MSLTNSFYAALFSVEHFIVSLILRRFAVHRSVAIEEVFAKKAETIYGFYVKECMMKVLSRNNSNLLKLPVFL